MHFITLVALVALVTFPGDLLGLPKGLPRELRGLSRAEIKPNRIESKPNPSQIKPKSNQNQIESKSNQNHYRILIEILGNPNKIIGNPRKFKLKARKSMINPRTSFVVPRAPRSLRSLARSPRVTSAHPLPPLAEAES